MTVLLTMRSIGTLTKWNDERGFGFIVSESPEQRVFVHISELKHLGGRPQDGLKLAYSIEASEQGPIARSVELVNLYELHPHECRKRVGARPRNSSSATHLRLLAIPLFIAGFAWMNTRWGLPTFWLYAYILMSLITFSIYALDKWAAKNHRRRVRESSLHLLGWLGGWPGALLAQTIFRHKTRKRSFLATFWFTALMNVGLLTALYFPQAPWNELARQLDDNVTQLCKSWSDDNVLNSIFQQRANHETPDNLPKIIIPGSSISR